MQLWERQAQADRDLARIQLDIPIEQRSVLAGSLNRLREHVRLGLEALHLLRQAIHGLDDQVPVPDQWAEDSRRVLRAAGYNIGDSDHADIQT